MATYVLPQVQVFQEFSVVPAAVANPLRAHISGPHAYLLRYAQSTEKEKGLLGIYDNLIDTPYDWPNRPAGGLVDDTYVKLWVQDAILQYFQDLIGGGSDITKVTGYNNRIRSASRAFVSNGDTYPRYAGLLDRDVQPGDVAKVRGLDGLGNSITLWTYVQSILPDTLASVVATPTEDSDNATTQSESTFVSFVSGPINCVSLTADGTAYDGLADGDIIETYDVVVTQSSVNGDFTTATVRVISGSGDDDQTLVVPEASGSPTSIGVRGLTVTFGITPGASCSASAVEEDISTEDLIVGQRWQVTVHQAFTEPVASTDDTYLGINDTTYIITVSRGGKYTNPTATKPQIMVTTTNGIDISGPTPIVAASTPVEIGTLGVTISFTGTSLCNSDRYYIDVTGEASGPMRTIQLGHNLDSTIPTDSEVDLTLYIHEPVLQIAQNRLGFAPLTNWDTSETQITVNSGILAFDTTWTNEGVQEPLPVCSEVSQNYGLLFVEYRAWVTDWCNNVGSVDNIADIDTVISGALDPDNPLKWGVAQALQNSNGVNVLFSSVCSPTDTDSWVNVLSLLLGRDDIYGLVPLTRDRTVLDLYQAHANAMSAAEQGLWRVLWMNLEGLPEIPIVSAGSSIPGHTAATTKDGLVALAVVEDDPQTAGTQYTIVRCTSANSNFIVNGVRAGDIVRTLYTGDGFGNESYSEYVVDEVQSEDQLRLLAGPDAPVNVASKFEVWRNLDATDEAAAIAINAGTFSDRRVRAVWPDTIDSSGTTMEGYFLCCALAGLRSGVLPHQGMTNLAIAGFTATPRTNTHFNRAQLDSMALGGVWIVTQNLNPNSAGIGEIYSRQALTTGLYTDINQREEMLTSNVDSISYRFEDYFAPFIGVVNVTPAIQARLTLEVGNLIETLKTESNTSSLGGQLIDATIVSLEPSLIALDTYILQLNLVVPYPFNEFIIQLSI